VPAALVPVIIPAAPVPVPVSAIPTQQRETAGVRYKGGQVQITGSTGTVANKAAALQHNCCCLTPCHGRDRAPCTLCLCSRPSAETEGAFMSCAQPTRHISHAQPDQGRKLTASTRGEHLPEAQETHFHRPCCGICCSCLSVVQGTVEDMLPRQAGTAAGFVHNNCRLGNHKFST
jgi:hypothetical protein